MKKSIIFLLVSLWLTSPFCVALSAQYHDNIWLMSATNGGVKIDFSTGEPEVSAIEIPIIFSQSSISMSNEEGDLIYYTNGCRIDDASFGLMENGSGLNPGNIYDEYCTFPNSDEFGYPQIGHGIISVPVPFSESEYLVLHKPIDLFYDEDGLFTGIWSFELLYSRIDMFSNGEYGTVVEKNTLVEVDSFESGPMTMNKAANGEDWWLIQPLNYSNEFYIYKVDSNGVFLNSIQAIGLLDDINTSALGQSVFSPDGSKYFRYNAKQGLRIFDFNRTTGVLDNFLHIPSPVQDGSVGRGGVGISPSGRYAYVSTRMDIWQYDLEAVNIAASRVHIAEITNPNDFIIHPSAHNFQLGPDCKLYVFNNSGISHHVIHSPDEPGITCDFEQGALEMPYPVFRDMPYFPHYRLGPLGDEGSPCAEPLVSTTEQPVLTVENAFEVYPNPTYGPVTVEGRRESIAVLRVIDGFGRVLEQQRWSNDGSNKRNLDLSHLPAGIYTLEVTTAEETVSIERLIIQ